MYPQEIVSYLEPLVMQLGSVNALNALPHETILAALSHPDDIIAVKNNDFEILLPGLVGGYEVVDPDYVVRHAVAAPTDNTFGKDAGDAEIVAGMTAGTFLYLSYDIQDAEEMGGTEPRFLMLVKAPPEAVEPPRRSRL